MVMRDLFVRPDFDDYENANGLLDCFDDPKGIPAEKTKLKMPILLSHYSAGEFRAGSFTWRLKSRNTNAIDTGATMPHSNPSVTGGNPKSGFAPRIDQIIRHLE